MLSAKFTEASRFQNSILTRQFDIPIRKSKIFVGRGEQLHEMENESTGIIDLTKFDNTLSRIHACVMFSPAWFWKDYDVVPKYLSYVSLQNQRLPYDVVQKIWQFLRPRKQCILKDMKSKVGLFSKIQSQEIQQEDMIVEFVHQSFITFQNVQIYENFEEIKQRVKDFIETNPNGIVCGNLNTIEQEYKKCKSEQEKQELLKIWRLSSRESNYLLLIHEGLVLRIGRSSHCQIQIKDTAISRYQAFLKCQSRRWKIIDGNQLEKSKNGTWKKCKSIRIPVSKDQNDIQKSYVKLGTIKCEIKVIETFEWLDLDKIVNGELDKSTIQLGMSNENEEQVTS